MGKIGYVIQEIGYEYNDEYYYRGESGGGTPKKIIINKDIAERTLMQLEIEKWRGEDLGYYEEEVPDIPNTATDEQIKSIIKSSSIRFYEMVEVEVEEELIPSNEEIEPTEDMLSLQDSPKSKGIFDSVDDFVSGDVQPTIVPEVVSSVNTVEKLPVEIKFTGEVEHIKEAVKETKEDFLSIKKEMKRLRDEARSKVKNFFIKGMDMIFDTYPEVKSVSWTQYTPHFNDGEPCNFWCNVGDFGVNGYSDYSDEGEDENSIDVFKDGEAWNYDWKRDENNVSFKVYKNPGARSVKIYEAISGFLNQLDSEDYMTMFGDHAEVIVRKGEITVEEYEHD